MGTGLIVGLEDVGSIPSRVRIFLFAATPRPFLGPLKRRIHFVKGTLLPKMKWRDLDAGHHLPIAVVKKRGALPPLLIYAFVVWCLSAGVIFTFTLI
jgi:hypothetical protein